MNIKKIYEIGNMKYSAEKYKRKCRKILNTAEKIQAEKRDAVTHTE